MIFKKYHPGHVKHNGSLVCNTAQATDDIDQAIWHAKNKEEDGLVGVVVTAGGDVVWPKTPGLVDGAGI